MRNVLSFLLFFTLSFVTINPALANNVEEKASHFVADIGKEVVANLAKNETTEAEKEKLLNDLLTKNFNLDFISRFVLGRYSRIATKSQFEEFKTAFQQYIITLYVKQFSNYTGEKFEVGRARLIKNGAAVYAKIVSKDKPTINLIFVVDASKEPYKIGDVHVEGISMLLTLRDDYTSYLGQSNNDIKSLIDELKNRIKYLKS